MTTITYTYPHIIWLKFKLWELFPISDISDPKSFWFWYCATWITQVGLAQCTTPGELPPEALRVDPECHFAHSTYALLQRSLACFTPLCLAWLALLRTPTSIWLPHSLGVPHTRPRGIREPSQGSFATHFEPNLLSCGAPCRFCWQSCCTIYLYELTKQQKTTKKKQINYLYVTL